MLHYPLFWYSAPSLLHRWIEQTFTHGFSHGRTGNRLKGKLLLLSFTSGAPEVSYRYGGPQHYPVDDFLPPYKQVSSLCGLQWCGYIYSGGLSYVVRHAHLPVERLRSMWQAHFLDVAKTAWQPDEQIAMPDVYAGIP